MFRPICRLIFDRFNQPGIGGKILDRREPFDIVNFVKDDQRQDLADTGNRAQQIQCVVIMLPGGFFDMPFQLFQDLVE